MIVGCLKDIKEIHYKGYIITRVYACGGKLVYTNCDCDGLTLIGE